MKITAVGGYSAVGRNMTGVSVNNETVAIDNGIRLDALQIYEDDEVDILKEKSLEELIAMEIVPDQSLLKHVSAQIISHGHLDHIGALPINRPKAPIVSNHYTAEICRKEHPQGDYFSVGYNEVHEISKKLSVEFIEVTHSIPYSSIVVLHTAEGDVVYASDFRFDTASKIAKTDYARLKEIGDGNPKALIVESTRVTEGGKTPSESVVKSKLSDVMSFIDSGLIIATTFSTHIERLQALLDEAVKADRTPLILGRSFSRQVEIGDRFGVLNMPPNARVYSNPKAIKRGLKEIERKEDYMLIVTGHQGEPGSVISRIADGRLPSRIGKGDSALLCANVIPSPLNYATRYTLETRLKQKGVRIYDGIHVSGHASKEDHRRMLNLIRPEHIIPCHGTMEMRSTYASLAAEEGYKINKQIHLMVNGSNMEL